MLLWKNRHFFLLKSSPLQFLDLNHFYGEHDDDLVSFIRHDLDAILASNGSEYADYYNCKSIAIHDTSQEVLSKASNSYFEDEITVLQAHLFWTIGLNMDTIHQEIMTWAMISLWFSNP